MGKIVGAVFLFPGANVKVGAGVGGNPFKFRHAPVSNLGCWHWLY